MPQDYAAQLVPTLGLIHASARARPAPPTPATPRPAEPARLARPLRHPLRPCSFPARSSPLVPPQTALELYTICVRSRIRGQVVGLLDGGLWVETTPLSAKTATLQQQATDLLSMTNGAFFWF